MNKQEALLPMIFLCILSGLTTPVNGQWKKYIIDDNLNIAVTIDTADLNGDSKLDLVTNSFGTSDIFWYENSYPTWIKHTVDEDASGVTFAYCGDLDGDDTIDIAACLYHDSQIAWYENNRDAWTKHIIDNAPDNPDATFVADINGDGRPDVLTSGDMIDGGDLVWYENKYPEWTKHIIEPGSVKWGGQSVTDLDGDGVSDILATMVAAGLVVWYKTEDNGLTWTKDTIDEDLPNAWAAFSGDIDGDGSLDIVATAGGPYRSGGEVIWYEYNNPEWIKHFIDPDLPGANWPVLADMNGDEKLDVVVGGFGVNEMVWYENNDSVWIKHIIGNDILGPRQPIVWDLDGDQFDDVLVAAGNSLIWYKNPGNTAYASSFEVTPYSSLSPKDSLTISAELHNPEGHPMDVFAIIQGAQFQSVDTIRLFDDGLHGDGDPFDQYWANSVPLSQFPEDEFVVDLVPYDSVTGSSNDYLPGEQFINLGPVSYEEIIFSSSEQVFTPGDVISFNIALANHSVAAVANNVYGRLASLDSRIAVSGSKVGFGDIPAGESEISSGKYQIKVSELCPPGTQLPVALEIFSDLQICWIDTLSILVYEEQPVYIPDTAFLRVLIKVGVDTNEDNLISYAEAEALRSLDISGDRICTDDSCWNSGQITSLTGIEAFINLDTLNCMFNQLTSLDISRNTALTDLVCYNNRLTSLDVSSNKALKGLACGGNLLSSLDVSANPDLEFLSCGNNQLTSLDVSNNTALVCLACQENLISDIDVSHCTSLNVFNCSNNLITSLDVSNNTELGSSMTCSYDSGFNITGMPSLYEVCVWEGFSPDSIYMITTGSPNVSFTTECSGSTELSEYRHQDIRIYPNPTYTSLTVKTVTSDLYIVITSLNGQVVYSVEMDGTAHTIDLSTFQKGVYSITIRSKDVVTTRKIIKL